MRKIAAILLGVALGSTALWAAPADVTYTEGDTSLRLKSGKTQDAQIGDRLNTGDTLRTGKDGLAELDQKGVTIKVASSTVFTLMEKTSGGTSTGVLSVALGSIKFRYDKLTGTEPQVRTNGMVAGVRGTEFSVFAGADGSTLITVDSGQVTVESQGASVDLAASEGVEVPLGRPPGDKFTVQRNQVDYSTWNEQKLAAMLADPGAALTSIETAIDSYVRDITQSEADFKDYSQRLADERAKRAKMADEQGTDVAHKYEVDVVSPLAAQTLAIGLNLRYSALAALSLRRFVSGRLYVMLKAKYISGRASKHLLPPFLLRQTYEREELNESSTCGAIPAGCTCCCRRTCRLRAAGHRFYRSADHGFQE